MYFDLVNKSVSLCRLVKSVSYSLAAGSSVITGGQSPAIDGVHNVLELLVLVSTHCISVTVFFVNNVFTVFLYVCNCIKQKLSSVL